MYSSSNNLCGYLFLKNLHRHIVVSVIDILLFQCQLEQPNTIFDGQCLFWSWFHLGVGLSETARRAKSFPCFFPVLI
jgi:hypothetical protein